MAKPMKNGRLRIEPKLVKSVVLVAANLFVGRQTGINVLTATLATQKNKYRIVSDKGGIEQTHEVADVWWLAVLWANKVAQRHGVELPVRVVRANTGEVLYEVTS